MLSAMGNIATTAAKAVSLGLEQIPRSFGMNQTQASHVVHVRTGDRKGAGTDANVWIILRDERGEATEEIKLNNWFKNDHERCKTSTFNIISTNHLGRIVEIELRRDKFGVGDAWFVDKIEVENRSVHATHYFPIQRWIKPYVRYVFREYDCCLPQHSKHLDRRNDELNEKKLEYEYSVNVPGGPAQIKNLPDDEKFTEEYTWDLLSHKAVLTLAGKIVQWTVDVWRSIESVKDVYRSAWKTLNLEEPLTLNHWHEDDWFGLQRVQGCNPMLIRLCRKIPENFGVTEEMILPFLEGLTFSEALEQNRLFYVDLKILDKLQCSQGRKLCAPLALFFLGESKHLAPIAIQLLQEKGADNPVFLPSDPPYTWILAKMHYNNADAIFHQSYTHLGFTHLIMEGVVVCTHRNLSPSHPLFRLLAPHFLFLLAINTRGLDKLVSEGGWVDRTMTCGRDGMFELIRRGLNQWRLDVDGTVPNELAAREVIDPEVISHYPYRDDALAIYSAIRTYVSKVVNHYYTSPEDIEQDSELLEWRRELVLSRDEGGVGMLGIPGDQTLGRFTTAEHIIHTVTSIISVCSIGHASANFQQYDEYAFPPNYPAVLKGDRPNTKKELTEQDVLAYLPDKRITVDVMIITNLLSMQGTNSLGDFETHYLYDPVSTSAATEFRTELKKISDRIQHANYYRKKPYPWLDPKIVPNAISI